MKRIDRCVLRIMPRFYEAVRTLVQSRPRPEILLVPGLSCGRSGGPISGSVGRRVGGTRTFSGSATQLCDDSVGLGEAGKSTVLTDSFGQSTGFGLTPFISFGKCALKGGHLTGEIEIHRPSQIRLVRRNFRTMKLKPRVSSFIVMAHPSAKNRVNLTVSEPGHVMVMISAIRDPHQVRGRSDSKVEGLS